MVSLEFFIDIILLVAPWPWANSASNSNEYQEYFLAGKGGRCVRLTTLPHSRADCLEIGNLNLLEPPGPAQACNGITSYIYIYVTAIYTVDVGV
jgi:hypothetical protein